MTVSDIYNGRLRGLSTDTKPTAPLGTLYDEYDTGDIFISDGTFWWLRNNKPAPFSLKKTGRYPAGTSGTAGDGLLQTLIGATGSGSQGFAIDNTFGRSLTATSGAVSGNKGGLRINAPMFNRAMNPRMKLRFKLNITTVVNIYLGFIGGSPAEPTGADPLGTGVPGVLFGVNTGLASNFCVMHNTTTGSTVVDNTGIPFDTTNIHTLYLVSDNANSRVSWALDNFNYTHITTALPTTANGLAPVLECETEEAVAKTFQIYDVYVQSDA